MIKIGVVQSIYDENDGGRIKVSISPDDDYMAEIPWAFPLLPKMLHVKPKIGEAVLIITSDDKNTNSQRYYIGPLISQSQYMDYDNFFYGATSTLNGGTKQPSSAVTGNPNVDGCLPDENDIAICGRRNSDIILTNNDIRIRCGVKEVDNGDTKKMEFNRLTPSYILLKHSPDNTITKSNVNVVAQDINLISVDGDGGFNVTDKDKLINDDVMADIIEKAHKLPYGDILIEFLSKMRDVITTHTHPYSMLPPCYDNKMLNLNEYDLNKMLSKHIRIN